MSKSININKIAMVKIVALLIIVILINNINLSSSAENNGAALPSDLELQWATQVGTIKSAPVIDDDFIYLIATTQTSTTVESEGTLFTILKRTGEIKWQYNLGAKSEYTDKDYASVTLYEDKLVVSSNNNGLVCLEKVAQNTTWSKPYNSINPPVILEDRIYFTISNRNLYCLDIETGDEIWSYPVGVTNCVPAIYGNYIFGADFERIFILNNNNGNEIVTTELYRTHQVEALSSPLVYDNKLIVTASDYTLHVFSLLGLEQNQLMLGNELWWIEGRTFLPHFSQPVVYKNKLYVCYNNELHARDLSLGTSIWHRELSGRHLGLSGDSIVIISDTTLYTLDPATGKTRWELDLAEELADAHTITNLNSAYIITDEDTIYIFEESGSIYKFSASTSTDDDADINYTLTICINAFLIIIIIAVIYAILKWRSKK